MKFATRHNARFLSTNSMPPTNVAVASICVLYSGPGFKEEHPKIRISRRYDILPTEDEGIVNLPDPVCVATRKELDTLLGAYAEGIHSMYCSATKEHEDQRTQDIHQMFPGWGVGEPEYLARWDKDADYELPWPLRVHCIYYIDVDYY